MNQYTTLRQQLHHIERLAQEEPLSYETQDEIAKTTLEALREIDKLELPPSPPQPVTLQLVEAEEEAAR